MPNSSISNFKASWRSRWLKALFFIPVFLGLLLLAGSKNEILGKFLLYGFSTKPEPYQGDLYDINLVQKFKHDFTIHDLQNGAPVDRAQYIALGDSFFYLGLDSEPVFNFLQNSLSGGVFYLQNQQEITPKNYLTQSGFVPGKPRIFIWETVERSSLYRAQALSADLNPSSPNRGKLARLKSLAASLAHKFDPFLSVFRPDKPRVEYLIRNNLLVKTAVAWMKNKDFEWFGDIDNVTPLYSSNPDMLFLNQEVDFHNDSGKVAQIDQAADNIAREAVMLKRDYNLQLVYVPIPDKLSIYYDAIKLPQPYSYDNYLPLLEQALEERGVATVDVYGAFVRYRQAHPGDLLYYPGDTHYTPLGKTMAETTMLKTLNALPK